MAVYRPPPGASPQENHAVLLVGYDNDRQFWLARNSWGVDWGDGGLFRVAFDTCAVLTPGSEAYGVVWRPKAVPDAVKLPVTPASPQHPGCYWYKARPGDYLSRVAWLAGIRMLEQLMLDNTAVVKDLDAPISGLQLLLCKPQPDKIRVVVVEPGGDQSAAATKSPPLPQQRIIEDAKKPAVDRQLQSLLKIKAAIDTTGVLPEWNEQSGADAGYCKGWTGIVCSGEDGSNIVEGVSLWDGAGVTGLQGTLPPASAFDGLPGLRWLSIADQPGIKGTLPADWSRLQQLQDIRLGRNLLTGQLPSTWSQIRGLTALYLDSNKLQGPLPESFKALTALETLSLGANDFNGVVPASWQSMTGLRDVSLLGNAKLGGCLPRSWKQQLVASFDVRKFVFDGTRITGFC